LSDRSCNGDWGKEVDLRRAFRRGLSFTLDEDGCCRIEGVAFPALFKDFRVALITSVAKIAFSLGDNSSATTLPFFWRTTFVMHVLGVRVVRVLATELPFKAVFEFESFSDI
jgi:hypothetical protein